MNKVYKILSKSQLKKDQNFSLNIFKKPFCYTEKKKYKIYEMPKFKTTFFKKQKVKDLTKKCIFISGPARSGNHLLLSMLDNHPEIDFDVGEDDMLRTVFSHANINEKITKKKLIELNFKYISSLSGQPKFGLGPGVNKWKQLYTMHKKKIKSNIWSGNQPDSEAHITDFQGIVQNINYPRFVKSLIKKKKIEFKIKNFIEFFDLYLASKALLTKSKKKTQYKYRWSGSCLRRELFYLLKRSKKIVCLTPIRRFENFYYSYAKTRHDTNDINQKALDDLWEHWRHKVIDYLILKKKYPEKVHIIKFEDLVNNPKKTSKKIANILNINYSKNMLSPTVLGVKSIGNSSFKKNSKVKGKIYKNSINKKLKNVELPREYEKIIALIDKVAI